MHSASGETRSGVLSEAEFERQVVTALARSAVSATFLALYVIDLTDGGIWNAEMRSDILAASETGESIGSAGVGSFAVLRPTVSSPADAIERCERLLAAVRRSDDEPVDGRSSVRIGVALHSTDGASADALFETARRGLRSAMRSDGDDWAVG